MTQETIVAIYDNPHAVEAACAELTAMGISQDALSWTSAVPGTNRTNTPPSREQGFWSSLFGGQPDHDTAVYDRSVESGSDVLTVRAAPEHAAQVTEILERHHPVDIDERAADYGMSRLPPASTDTIYGRGDAVIGLSEEQLQVGKRVVDRGTTRVRRFVVETPVAEDVTLHSERVSIERRPASGIAASAPAFTDQVIEMTETDEEAVIGKTSRVVEEVVVHKASNDRVETIRDTVRHEDVEITHDDLASPVATDIRAPRTKI